MFPTLVKTEHPRTPHGHLDLLVVNCSDVDNPEIIIRIVSEKESIRQKAVDHITIEAKGVLIHDKLEG